MSTGARIGVRQDSLANEFDARFTGVPGAAGIRPGVYAGFQPINIMTPFVSRVYALLFYTNIASASASGPNTCQQRVMSCKR